MFRIVRHSRKTTKTQCRGLMMQRAQSMQPRRDPWATIGLGRIGQRDPTGQIVLRLNKCVAVVLMPWKLFCHARFFIDALIPIQPYVRADEVRTQIREQRMATQLREHIAVQHQMRAKRDLVGARNAVTPIRALAQLRFGLGLQRINRADNNGEFVC